MKDAIKIIGGKPAGFDDVFIYVPKTKEIICIFEGTGDNLLKEDIDRGFVDYLNYEQYELSEDMENFDGGMILSKELLRDKYQCLADCIPSVMDFIYDTDSFEVYILNDSSRWQVKNKEISQGDDVFIFVPDKKEILCIADDTDESCICWEQHDMEDDMNIIDSGNIHIGEKSPCLTACIPDVLESVYGSADIPYQILTEKNAKKYPDGPIKTMLQSGPCADNGKARIVQFFSASHTLEEKEDFLKAVYNEKPKGFFCNGHEYAFFPKEEGIAYAPGSTARDAEEFISWESAVEGIQVLLESGEYGTKEFMETAVKEVLREKASSIVYMRQDMVPGLFRLLFKDLFPDMIGKFSYNKETDYIAEKIEDPLIIKKMLEIFEAFVPVYESCPKLIRFRFYKPQNMIKALLEIAGERLYYYTGTLGHDPEVSLNDDMVDDYILYKGSSSELSIYSFFLRNKDKKERAHFLKEGYGIGGSTHAVCGMNKSYSNRDGKGLTLSLHSIKKFFPYKKLEERYDRLIKAGLFPLDKTDETLDRYEKQVVLNAVSGFELYLPCDVDYTIHIEGHFTLTGKELYEKYKGLVEDKEKLEEILASMKEALWKVPEDYFRLDSLKEDCNLVAGYLDGTYKAFPMESPKEIIEPACMTPDIPDMETEGKQLSLFDFI